MICTLRGPPVGKAKGKSKIPFRRHALPPPPPPGPTPQPDRPERTEAKNPGYWPGSAYSTDELAWLKRVEAFMKRTKRKFLSHVDYFRLALDALPELMAAKGVTAPDPPPPKKKRPPKPLGRTLFDDLPDDA